MVTEMLMNMLKFKNKKSLVKNFDKILKKLALKIYLKENKMMLF